MNEKKQIKTPLSVIMSMAKNELENHVLDCMSSNNIPSFLMAYIIKDILLNIQQISIENMANEFTSLQTMALKEEE